MEELNGSRLSEFPYSELFKVCNLVEFDGPLLSHYKDKFENNFLFYWVDNDHQVNRWLLLEVTKDFLYDYLNNRLTLRELILSNSNVIITDIDRDLTYRESFFLTKDQIPSDYLPDDDSFFHYDLPVQYQTFETSKNEYFNVLREGANVYRLRPTDHIFNHAVKARDAGKFLTNLTNSASVYTTFEFYNRFKDSISDPDKLKSALLNVKRSTELLVIDTQFKSFEVTLSIDTVIGKEEGLQGYTDWRKSILKNYYDDVININHSSDEGIRKLQEKFPEEALRKKIIKPIADILVDSSFALETKGSIHKSPVAHKSITRTTYKKLIAPVLDDNAPEQMERKKIINLIVEVTEKNGKTIFGRKAMAEGIISQNEMGVVNLSTNYLDYENYEISFKIPLEYQYFIDTENTNNIFCPAFNLSATGQSKKEVMNDFWRILGNFVVSSIENDNNKELMEEFVEDVKERSYPGYDVG